MVVSTDESAVVKLVDAPEDDGECASGLLTNDEVAAEGCVKVHVLDRSGLSVSRASLAIARSTRELLESTSQGDPAETILEGLVAGEVGVAHELQDLEGAATALLGRTLGEPLLALHVAKVAREIFALSSTIRRRTESTLGAIADLRAQRLMMSLQRARFHD